MMQRQLGKLNRLPQLGANNGGVVWPADEYSKNGSRRYIRALLPLSAARSTVKEVRTRNNDTPLNGK
jgi:hypothetical protein